MTNSKKPGHFRRYTNSTSATITSGTLVVLRSGASGEVGVAIDDIAAGAVGDVAVSGEFTLTAAVGAISAHALVYRNSSNAITTSSTSNTLAGVSVVAKTTAATSITILLNGRPGPTDAAR